MKTIFTLLFGILLATTLVAQQGGDIASSPGQNEIIRLSNQKWQWMADKNTDSLQVLFHDKSVFVHMGGSWGKQQELDVIKTGNIWYKKADIHSTNVNIIDHTAILLSNITLLASTVLSGYGTWLLVSYLLKRVETGDLPSSPISSLLTKENP